MKYKIFSSIWEKWILSNFLKINYILSTKNLIKKNKEICNELRFKIWMKLKKDNNLTSLKFEMVTSWFSSFLEGSAETVAKEWWESWQNKE